MLISRLALSKAAMGAPIDLADPALCRQPLSAVIPHLSPRAATGGLTAIADGHELCFAVNVIGHGPPAVRVLASAFGGDASSMMMDSDGAIPLEAVQVLAKAPNSDINANVGPPPPRRDERTQ